MRLLAAGVVLFVVAVLAWVLTRPAERETVLVPIVASPVTPLRDSGPENNAPRKKAERGPTTQAPRHRPSQAAANGTVQSPTRADSKRRSPARKPPKAHSPPRRPDSSQGGSQGSQPGNQPPPQEPEPVVTVPSVCVNGLVEVGDCG